MHYRNGTEAKVGDFVRGMDWQDKPVVGQVSAAYPGNTTCNIVVAHTIVAPVAVSNSYTAGDFELICREDGSDGVPDCDKTGAE